MKKLKNLLAVAAIISLTVLGLGCDPAPSTPSTPSNADSTKKESPTSTPNSPSKPSNTNSDPSNPSDPETPVGPKYVTSEEELVEMFSELSEEIKAFFIQEEPTKPTANARSAASEEEPEKELTNVEKLGEFIASVMGSITPDDDGKISFSGLDLDIKNLSCSDILEIASSLMESDNPVDDTASEIPNKKSIDEFLKEYAAELNVSVEELVEELVEKLDESICVSTLKLKGDIEATMVEETKIYESGYSYYPSKSKYALSTLKNVEEAIGVKAEKLDELVKFLLPEEEKSFPLKAFSFEQSANISKAYLEMPLGTKDGEYEKIPEDAEEWEALKEKVIEKGCYNVDKMKGDAASEFDGTISVNSSLAFETSKSKYTGKLEVELNITSTTELLRELIEFADSEPEDDSKETTAAYNAEYTAKLNKLGSLKVKVSNDETATFTKEYGFGELIDIIGEISSSSKTIVTK